MNTILLIGLLFLALAFLLIVGVPFCLFTVYVLGFAIVVFVIGLIAQWKFK